MEIRLIVDVSSRDALDAARLDGMRTLTDVARRAIEASVQRALWVRRPLTPDEVSVVLAWYGARPPVLPDRSRQPEAAVAASLCDLLAWARSRRQPVLPGIAALSVAVAAPADEAWSAWLGFFASAIGVPDARLPLLLAGSEPGDAFIRALGQIQAVMEADDDDA